MEITEILKIKPKVKIKPHTPKLRDYNSLTPAEAENVDTWLAYCNFGIGMLDVGTKALKNNNFMSNRNGVFDLINEFKRLDDHYHSSVEFQDDRRELEDFVYTFLTSTPEQRKRVIKVQESIIK